MALINKEWKRKVRISCRPGIVSGRGLYVVDAETGEDIHNILSMVIRLDAKSVNTCEITYHEMGGDNFPPKPFFEPEARTVTVENVEIDDLTAFEIMDEIRKEMR